MSEQALLQEVLKIKGKIKAKLAEKSMSQVELAKILDVNTQVLSKAIGGDMSPRGIEIRKQIYELLEIKN